MVRMKKSGEIWAGNLACLAAYTIFGLNIVCSKNIAMDGHLTPMALQCIRSCGATVLFWLIAAAIPATRHERLERKDLPAVLAAAFLGLFYPYFSFLQAIPHISATDCGLLLTLSPVMTLLISSVVLRQRPGWSATGGVALSLCGVLLLTLTGATFGGSGQSSAGGLLLMLSNPLSFSLYLVLFRPLIVRYSVICFMKWMFLFSSLMTLPLSVSAFGQSDLSALPAPVTAQVIYLVVATCVTYFLIPFGQKRLHPVIVSLYTYLQPLTAMFLSVILDMEALTWTKILATLLVFAGAALVNFSKKST